MDLKWGSGHGDCRALYAPLEGATNDRLCDRVLARSIDPRSQSEKLLLGRTVEGEDRRNCRSSSREGPRLVEGDRRDGREALDKHTALDEDAIAGAGAERGDEPDRYGDD